MKGSSKIKKSDWSQGENSFADITAGVAQLAKTGYLGRYALVVSPDLFLDLQRLQPNTGLLEIDRIKKLIGDNVYMTSVMGPGKAVLVCAEPEYLDLAIGLDLSVGYLELADFNQDVYKRQMLAIAEIPLGPIRFTGCIGIVALGETEYRFATYRGVRIVEHTPTMAEVRQGDMSLRVEVLDDRGHKLQRCV